MGLNSLNISVAPHGQVTSTLAALLMSVDNHILEDKKGNRYRPELYMQNVDGFNPVKSLDYMKLSHRAFIHGMTRVLQSMVQDGDP